MTSYCTHGSAEGEGSRSEGIEKKSPDGTIEFTTNRSTDGESTIVLHQTVSETRHSLQMSNTNSAHSATDTAFHSGGRTGRQQNTGSDSNSHFCNHSTVDSNNVNVNHTIIDSFNSYNDNNRRDNREETFAFNDSHRGGNNRYKSTFVNDGFITSIISNSQHDNHGFRTGDMGGRSLSLSPRQRQNKPNLNGHYLGEFAISYKPVKHGIGATHSSLFIPLL